MHYVAFVKKEKEKEKERVYDSIFREKDLASKYEQFMNVACILKISTYFFKLITHI